MTADALNLFICNDQSLLASVQHNVKMLRMTVDQAAQKLAKVNAEWHDDPSADDHAAFHAPASEQFPQAMRDEVIRDLVAFYLSEMTIAK